MFDCAHHVGGSGAARRRRDKRLRMHRRYEAAVPSYAACVHGTSQLAVLDVSRRSYCTSSNGRIRCCCSNGRTHYSSSSLYQWVPDPVVLAAPATCVLVPAATHATTAFLEPVNFVHVTPAPVIDYIASSSAATGVFVDPQFSFFAVEASASQVVGSVPLVVERVQGHTVEQNVQVPTLQIQEHIEESFQFRST